MPILLKAIPAGRYAVFLLFFIFLLLCVARLLTTQTFRSSYLSGLAKKQQNLFLELEPLRGTIYDSNLKPLAINLPAESLYLNTQVKSC